MFETMLLDDRGMFTFADFNLSDLEQELISEILEDHDVESCFVIGRKKRKAQTDDTKNIDRYIKLKPDNRYTIVISLARVDYDDISGLVEEIESETFFWERCYPSEKLWYAEGMQYITCLSADHRDRVLVFE